MRLEVGKFYRTRDGQKAGPMDRSHLSSDVFLGAMDSFSERRAWYGDGAWSHLKDDNALDLIAEWSEPSSPSGAVETITTKHIKAGLYGRINVGTEVESPRIWIEWTNHHSCATAPELRSAAVLFLELADFLSPAQP